jgi:ERI1 exoribonuclease 3
MQWTRTAAKGIPSATQRMAAAAKPARRHPKYLLILDFEATCGESFDRREQEIIEFPTLLYDLQKNEVQALFHEYVKPVAHPTLTEFCTNLTGIAQVRRTLFLPFI